MSLYTVEYKVQTTFGSFRNSSMPFQAENDDLAEKSAKEYLDRVLEKASIKNNFYSSFMLLKMVDEYNFIKVKDIELN